jgi:murein DD-endopeptidase MepM/ murein hydrolase activator NlpD
MHLNMKRLAVTAGQSVKAGDLIGYVSNDFGGTATTIHLYFEIVQNTAEHGWVHVPPYLSLVASYERRENGPGEELEAEIGVASTQDVFVIPEGYEIIE